MKLSIAVTELPGQIAECIAARAAEIAEASHVRRRDDRAVFGNGRAVFFSLGRPIGNRITRVPLTFSEACQEVSDFIGRSGRTRTCNPRFWRPVL